MAIARYSQTFVIFLLLDISVESVVVVGGGVLPVAPGKLLRADGARSSGAGGQRWNPACPSARQFLALVCSPICALRWQRSKQQQHRKTRPDSPRASPRRLSYLLPTWTGIPARSASRGDSLLPLLRRPSVTGERRVAPTTTTHTLHHAHQGTRAHPKPSSSPIDLSIAKSRESRYVGPGGYHRRTFLSLPFHHRPSHHHPHHHHRDHHHQRHLLVANATGELFALRCRSHPFSHHRNGSIDGSQWRDQG